MRILCLHGVGSSATVLENQLRHLIRAVDPTFEFIFVNGPIPCERGPGIGLHIEGPFFSHTVGYSADDMDEALEHFTNTLDELGPFNGVLGFSQGAALAVSYMHRQRQRREMVPFQFALLFSSVMPCSATPTCCSEVIQNLVARGQDVTDSGLAKGVCLTREERLFVQLLHRTIIPAKKQRQMLPDYDLAVYSGGDGIGAPRIMHPELLSDRILIPTVHVTGKRDLHFMRAMSQVAYELCDERYTKKLEHSGGHEPPQKAAEVKAVTRALEWAIRTSEVSHARPSENL
ncbi:DUF341 domain protein [Corynespora cassiicola Philippines]|uniref:DUF341 domain protein n=1 Tax=Corynespora cassiicola Philippines TaxID=1448308 RepID=A0A2T2N1X6_CORCC|nr:DUF341 domain protein [Corynespora cassiicola Philippines]